MPSKSLAQHKLMQIAAHTKGGFGGVPQKVGKDFAAADAGNSIFQGMRQTVTSGRFPAAKKSITTFGR